MAEPEPVAPIEGYRSRDHDGVEFVGPDVAPEWDPTRVTRVIDAAQLVLVGEVDFDACESRPDKPGEWGRIGPERRVQRRVPPAGDPFDEANPSRDGRG